MVMAVYNDANAMLLAGSRVTNPQTEPARFSPWRLPTQGSVPLYLSLKSSVMDMSFDVGPFLHQAAEAPRAPLAPRAPVAPLTAPLAPLAPLTASAAPNATHVPLPFGVGQGGARPAKDIINDLMMDLGRNTLGNLDEIQIPPQTLATSAAESNKSKKQKKKDASPSSAWMSKPITSLMLCNIPCCLSQAQLAEIIDLGGFEKTYDYLYLPMPTHGWSSQNLGYGFMNFITPEDADRFMRHFQGHDFEGTSSLKAMQVKHARIQGLSNNIRNFKRAHQKDRRCRGLPFTLEPLNFF